jgi:hypothetical protein
MDATPSNHFPLPISQEASLDQAGTSPSVSSEDSEPGFFDNHTVTTTDSSKKRSLSHTDFSSIDGLDELKERKITPVNDSYEWDPDEEKKVHHENTNDDHLLNEADMSSLEQLEHEALHTENIFENFESGNEDDASISLNYPTSSSVRSSAPQRQQTTPKDELSGATAALMEALHENNSLSHEKAMEIARAALTNEGAKPRTLEEKAFKSVMQVFNKLLHKNSSIASPDAHLKHQDRFYDADVEQGLHAGLSEKGAYKNAILRAGQRSFYFNPKQNAQEAKNQARTGIAAARDYFMRRTNISSEVLPTIEELLPEITKSRILTR